ncbi:hypothetical protein CRENBAI_005667 [Crenichthys baileyi]|uniref:Uncharacterized protein n=1 Tax=Crenichthys baileyi TaxID=28760 RepID=A0AAV9R7R9_9TELE
MATAVNIGVDEEGPKLCTCEECIHCAGFSRKLLCHRLACPAETRLCTDEVCDGLAIFRSFPEGDGDEDGAEPDDSELMLSDDEDEDSTVLDSYHEAAKPPAAEDDSKPAVLCPLDLDVQDKC